MAEDGKRGGVGGPATQQCALAAQHSHTRYHTFPLSDGFRYTSTPRVLDSRASDMEDIGTAGTTIGLLGNCVSATLSAAGNASTRTTAVLSRVFCTRVDTHVRHTAALHAEGE